MSRYFIANIDAYVGRYPICDARHGGRREPVAHCYDAEMAQRIVALLNADERLRQKPTNRLTHASEFKDSLDGPNEIRNMLP